MMRIKNNIDFFNNQSESKLLINRNSIASSDNYRSRDDLKYTQDSLYEDDYIYHTNQSNIINKSFQYY